MDQKEKNIQITNSIENAKRIAVMPSSMAGADAFCAGVGLYLMLKEKDKQADLIYPYEVPTGCEDLISSDDITSDPRENELLVSIDYSDSLNAKAQYSTNDGFLYIRLKPVENDFDTSKVKAEIKGETYDVIITIGAQVLEDFGQVYRDMEKDIYRSKLINIDNKAQNLKFGNINVIDPSAASLSTLTLDTSRFWKLRLSDIAAKAFLRGITYKNH